MNFSRRTLFVGTFVLLACLTSWAAAEVRLPSVFSDHMVLQRDKPVALWGWADAGEQVTISVGSQTKSTTADSSGKWSLSVGPFEAGGPHAIVVRGENTLRINDVLVGEVWLCSGQSNMAMAVRSAANAEQETAAADFPNIRMLTVERQASESLKAECQGQWQVCSSDTVGGFSATAYYFGRALHKETGLPVGLINSSWGGTAVEAWTSLDAQTARAELAPILKPWEEQIAGYDADAAQARHEKALVAWKEKAKAARGAGRKPPRRPQPPSNPRLNQNRPANLFNGMIHPLVPYGIRGALWYQGERNSRDETSALYGLQLQTMIADWRTRFAQGDVPFFYVQLPNYLAPQQTPSETTGWVMVREGMLKTLATKKTGMAITVDIGEEKDIHPKNKQDVGIRLALWALATVHGEDIVHCGPILRSFRVTGGKSILAFDHAGDQLKTSDGRPVKGFAVAGADRKFVWAEAEFDGDTVIVSSPEVDAPVAVRYAWANNPDCNLVNSVGLPASPFRTDDWKEPIQGR